VEGGATEFPNGKRHFMTRKLMVTGYGGFVAGSTVWQALRDGGWDG